MKKQPIAYSVEVEVDGVVYDASYTVSAKVVTVDSEHGTGSTQIGGSGDMAVARMLLREIIAGAKRRGEI